jgi:hypothetical protein
MRFFKRPGGLVLVIISVIVSCGWVHATDVKVHFQGKSQFTSITSALKTLDPSHSNTITVSDKCHENVLIQGFSFYILRSLRRGT